MSSKIVASFTLGGRKAWAYASAAVRRVNASAIHVKIKDDFLVIFAQDDKVSTRSVTTSVSVSETREGQFAIPVSTMESIIGKRNDNITFNIHDDSTLSFSSGGRFHGSEIMLLPWNEDLEDSSFEMPHLKAPTFPISDQRKIISAMKLAALRGVESSPLDVHVRGNGEKLVVGSISNIKSTLSTIVTEFKGSFLLSEDALSVLSSLEKEPFALEETGYSLIIQTENATISTPKVVPNEGPTLKDVRNLIRQEASYEMAFAVSEMKAALSDISFLFERSLSTTFKAEEGKITLSISGEIGKADGVLDSDNTHISGDPIAKFGMRGSDILEIMGHLSGYVTFRCLKNGICISTDPGSGVDSQILVGYYS